MNRKLRVAMIVPPYFDVPPSAYGGVEAVVADLTNALVARGHEVTVVGAGRPGTSADFLPVWERTIPERLGDPFAEVTHAAVTRKAVERLADCHGLDMVHDHTVAGPLNARHYATMGLPTTVTVHGAVADDVDRFYQAVGADTHLVAISRRQRALAPGLNWVATVHNALRIDDWPYRDRKEDYALFLGRFHPDKGPHLALDAAHAAGVPLVLAGKCAEPEEKQYFEKEIRPRLTGTDQVVGVADAVRKRELLAGARALLFPVRWEEAFGMVMIEAMACGTPVVALRAGSVPEVVADGITGLIRDEPEELAQALLDAAAVSPAACREHVALRFNESAMAAGYEAAYGTVIRRFWAGAPAPRVAVPAPRLAPEVSWSRQAGVTSTAEDVA
jgi:glycosyltransferase involved in cell wall biosynthesis